MTVFTATGRNWQRFWFEPQETSSLALFRIAFGLIAVGWTVSLLPNLFAFYGPRGILPDLPVREPGEWGLLSYSTSPTLLLTVVAVTLAAAFAVTIGLFTRVAAVVLWIGIVSLEQRNVFVTNAGDGVLRQFAFFLALSPAGAALSVDRLRTAPGRFWEFPACTAWALRLIQIQVSLGYLAAVWNKAQTDLWLNGTAVSYALRIEDIHRFPTPSPSRTPSRSPACSRTAHWRSNSRWAFSSGTVGYARGCCCWGHPFTWGSTHRSWWASSAI